MIDIFATVYVVNIANALQDMLQKSNIQTTVNIRTITNADIKSCTTNQSKYMFLLCSQWVYPPNINSLPRNKYFVYQLEQFDKSECKHIHTRYVYNLFQNALHIFEYSKVNLTYYDTPQMRIPTNKVTYLMPPVVQIDNIQKTVKDIDVLFCGSINQRRASIFNSLQQNGIKLTVLHNKFGNELQILIKRAKIFLNLRFSDSKILETCRLHEAITSDSTFIVSEEPETPLDDISIYGTRIHFVKKNDLDSLTKKLKNILQFYHKSPPFVFDSKTINDVTSETLISFISNK
jgi:hypothetical protein